MVAGLTSGTRRLVFDLSIGQAVLPELLRGCAITRRTELQGYLGFEFSYPSKSFDDASGGNEHKKIP
jgi:hypothetical protein